mgnify:CR=1 FL=1
MATKFNSSSSIDNFKEKVQVEIRRLRGLNPHVVVMGMGWQKLVAQARVNVCSAHGLSIPVFNEVLQSHMVGMDASIVINNGGEV